MTTETFQPDDCKAISSDKHFAKHLE